jgi:hypothetical protein
MLVDGDSATIMLITGSLAMLIGLVFALMDRPKKTPKTTTAKFEDYRPEQWR